MNGRIRKVFDILDDFQREVNSYCRSFEKISQERDGPSRLALTHEIEKLRYLVCKFEVLEKCVSSERRKEPQSGFIGYVDSITSMVM